MKHTVYTFFLAAILAASCNNAPLNNVALLKTATASSSFDNNLTAQLLTDGLVSENPPAWLEVVTSGGEVDKVERENTLDGDKMSRIIVVGESGWIEFKTHGYSIQADEAEVLYQEALPGGKGGPLYCEKIPVEAGDGALRLNLAFPKHRWWRIKETTFYCNGIEVTDILPRFTSAWLSEGCAEEWVMIDLGSVKAINGVNIHWVTRPESGFIETSKDGSSWTTKAQIGESNEISFPANCRYVRLQMNGGQERCCIAEIEVLGREKKNAPAAGSWMLQRASEITEDGEALSKAGFDSEGWIPATVPGTILSSFIDLGAVPDPDFGDNWAQISDSYFHSDFWYRHEFTQSIAAGKRYFLCLDGINWKAEVYLNGHRLNDIEGAFIRSRQEVTDIIANGDNALAIKIIHNAHPGVVKTKTGRWTGYNGGILGADNPTFHASIGWDWMTTVRGRNCGIWGDVHIEEKGGAQVCDPLVTSVISENGKASVTASVFVNTIGPAEVEGWIGDIRFSKAVSGNGEVSFGPDEFPQLKDTDLKLWWPNGYGWPELHEAGFIVKIEGEAADSLSYKAGIREIKWSEDGGKLKLYVNGRRINPMGGNWGFCQQNLRFSTEDYITAVDYHRQMNFNMIRNWVGQVPHKAFYDACDACGILVWQDFWLANPADGPDPDDETMFLANAKDYVRRIRSHPSIALYCGRNEGFPPKTLDDGLRECTASLHPGIHYISSSADGPVGGHGPYNALPVKDYFQPLEKFHSERGMPNIPVFETLQATMPAEDLWPQSDMWGKHDFTTDGAQKATTYNSLMTDAFGEITDAETFAGLAQWIDYDGYRAIFEGANSSGRQGMILWMSHSCWPDLVFCTYDYFFRPGGAFFGSKKACEPLHIQYNPITGKVEYINNGVGDVRDIWARACVYDWHGECLSDYMAIINSLDDTTTEGFDVERPDGKEPYFIALNLGSQNGNTYSENFYMIPGTESGLKSLRTLPEAKLETSLEEEDGVLYYHICNADDVPALMLRLILTDADGKEVLPILYSDNYFSLMPGQEKDVFITWPESIKVKSPAIKIKQLATYN